MNLQGLMFARFAREESTLAVLRLRSASIAPPGGLQEGRGKLIAMTALGGAIHQDLDQSFALYAIQERWPLEIPRAVHSARVALFLPPRGRSLVSTVPWGNYNWRLGKVSATLAMPGSL